MKRLLIIFLTVLVFVTNTHSADLMWVSSSNGSWTNSGNWSPAQVPGSNDTAIINTAVIIQVDSPVTVSNVVISQGTIGGSNTLTVLGKMTNSTTISGSVLIASNALMQWTAGYLEGNLTIAVGGSLMLSNSLSISYPDYAYGATNIAHLNNNGTVVQNGSISGYGNSIPSTPGCIIQNAGLWQVNSDVAINNIAGMNQFINSGTLSKLSGAGISTIDWNFTSTGAINTPAGMFSLHWSGNSLLHGSPGLTGIILTNASLIVASNSVLNSSGIELDGTLTVANGATLVLSNSLSISVPNYYYNQNNISRLTNNGTVVQYTAMNAYGNSTNSLPGAIFYNAGLWQVADDNSFNVISGTASFINTGSFIKTSGSGTSSVNWNFTSTGILNSPSGVLNLNWAGTNILNGSPNIVGTITSNTMVTIASGATMNWNAGELDGSLIVAVGGQLVISNSLAFSYPNYVYSYTNVAALTNFGTVLQRGTLNGYGNTASSNPNTFVQNFGSWQIDGDQSITPVIGVSVFSNSGSILKTSGTSSAINWNFSSTGTINTISSLLSINWVGTSTLNGTPALSGTITSNASVTIASNAVMTLSSGELDGVLTVAPGAFLVLTNALTFSYPDYLYSFNQIGRLTNFGTVIQGCSITGYGNPANTSPSYVIHNGGLWRNEGDFSLNIATGFGNFINATTLTKAAGTISSINWNFTSTGIINTPSGVLSLYWTGSSVLNGAPNITGAITSNATVTIAPFAVMNFTSGELDGNLFVSTNATLNLSNSFTVSYMSYISGNATTAHLTNQGTVIQLGNINAYGLNSSAPAGILVQNNALWQVVGDFGFSQISTNLFYNAGTFVKNGGSGLSSFAWNFYNMGSLESTTGTIGFSSLIRQTSGTTRIFTGTISTTQPFELAGGLFTGTNTLGGSLTNISGVVNPGNNLGKLSITGDYSQSSNATLQIDIAGTAIGLNQDQLAVSGAVLLAGNVVANFVNGYTPVTNLSFTYLTFASRTGSFQTLIYPTNYVGLLQKYTASTGYLFTTNAPPRYGPYVASGSFITHFQGIPGTNYTIEFTPALPATSWQKLTNVVAPLEDVGLGMGALEVRDTLTSSNRFYRTVTPAY